MALSNKELDQLADDQYTKRRITNSTYCSQCGYNLKTLPYKYQCPECGNEYNARPLIYSGIYFPHQNHLPIGDFIACLFFTLILFVYAVKLPPTISMIHFMMISAITVASTTFGVRSYSHFKQYLLTRSIAKHIADQERDPQET